MFTPRKLIDCSKHSTSINETTGMCKVCSYIINSDSSGLTKEQTQLIDQCIGDDLTNGLNANSELAKYFRNESTLL